MTTALDYLGITPTQNMSIANKASNLKPKKKEDVKITSSTITAPTQQTGSYLDVLAQRKQELQNKLDTTTQQEPTPVLNFGMGVSQKGVTNFQDYKKSLPVEQKTSGIIPTAYADNGEQNVIQMFLDDSKNNPDLETKRNAVIQMLQNGEDENFIQDTIINKMGYTGPKQEQPLIQDQYKNEGIVEQGLKSIPRGLMDTAQQIITGAEQAGRGTQNVLSKTVGDYGLYPVLNAIGYAIKGDNYKPISSQDMLLKENITGNVIGAGKEALLGEKGFSETYKQLNQADVEKYGNQGLLSDITDITAGGSRSAFNLFKAPVATGLNIASEAPGTQYITQLFGTGIDKTSEAIANETGMDKNAVQNTIETFMNSLGFKAGKGTFETAGNIKTAFKEAPSKTRGIYEGGKILTQDIGQGVYDVVKMPYDLAKTTIKAPYTLGKIGIEQGKNLYNKAKTGFGKENVTGVTEKGTIFEIEQTPGIKTNISDKIFNKDNEVLAQQAIMPKATKEKTLEARKKSGQTALEGIKQLYEDNANGIIKSNIRNMVGGVEGVEQGLSHYGTKIGELTKNKVTVEAKDLVDNLEASLNKPFSGINASMKGTIQNIINEFRRVKNKASIEDLQNALSNIKSEIFDNKENISKLYKTNTGKALNEFLKTLEDRFNTTIENTTGNLPELLEAKKAYSKYKKIQKDFIDSLMVDLRNQGKGITGTAGKVAGIYELLQNPTVSGIFKAIALKQAGETMQYYKTRSGNYETLIRNLDREAIQRNLKSNTIKNDLNNSTSSNTSDNAESLKPNQTTNVSNKPLQKTSKTGRELLSKVLPSNFKEKAQDFVEGVVDKVGARQKLLGGEGAKQVPTNLEKAKNWEKSGKSADEIWKETGWERGTDGKWRFEIDDSKAKLKKGDMYFDKEGNGIYTTVGDILEHSELFKQYPQIKNIRINFDKKIHKDLGSYNPTKNEITFSEQIVGGGEILKEVQKDFKSTLLHEIQHNIQEIENFGRGGSPKLGREMAKELEFKIDEYNTQLSKLAKENKTAEYEKVMNKKLETVKELKNLQNEFGMSGFEGYKKLAGETEARNVQSRLLKTPEERKLLRPAKTEDVAREKQIVKMEGGKAMSIDKTKLLKPSDDTIKYSQDKITIPGKGELNYEIGKGIMDIDLINVSDRRKGIGTKLMKEAEKIAKEKGLKKIQLSAQKIGDTTLEELDKFYIKNGYVKDRDFEGIYYKIIKD